MKTLHARARIAIVAAVALATVSAPALATPDSAPAVEPTAASSIPEPAAPDSLQIPVYVPFLEGKSLEEATAEAAAAGDEPIGFRHENGGVAGEFFLTPTQSLRAFDAEYKTRYETQPRIVGYYVYQSDGGSAARLSSAPDPDAVVEGGFMPSLPTYELEPADDEAPPGARPAQARQAAAQAAAPWAPGPMTMMNTYPVGSQSHLTIYGGWNPAYGHHPDLGHPAWGLEIEVAQTDGSFSGTRPFCQPGTYSSFWLGRHGPSNNGIDSWDIRLNGSSNPYSAAAIGGYWDWLDSVDPCSRQTISYGIGRPQRMPDNAAGGVDFQIDIRTPRGSVASSRFYGQYDTVFNDCEFEMGANGPIRAAIPLTPASQCMGLTPSDQPRGLGIVEFVPANQGHRVRGCYESWVDELGAYIPAWVAPLECVGPFSDVPAGMQFEAEMRWMRERGITTGFAGNSYLPLTAVNRDAMAAFLYRLVGSPPVTLPASSPFTDVSPTDQHYRAMVWMRNSGISTGYADGTFRPLEPVRRDAMAAFLFRLSGDVTYMQPAQSPFSDVFTSTAYYREMAWMRDKGISTGWPDGTYRPLEPVNRDAMSAFLHRFAKAYNW
jgi:S-layer homology domain